MSIPTFGSRFTAAQAGKLGELESGLCRFAFRLGHVCNVAHKWPTQADVDARGNRLHARFEPLRCDQNSHRAHRHEHKKVTAKELALPDVIEHLKGCQDLLTAR